MNAETPMRIVIADPYVSVREGVAALLGRQPDMQVLGHASNGTEALALFRQLLPDMLVMELDLPDMDGVEIIACLRAEFPDACVFVLTAEEGDEHIYTALKAGARGYFGKTAPGEVIAQAVRQVRTGQIRLAEHLSAKLAKRLHSGTLTPREREVLRQIATLIPIPAVNGDRVCWRPIPSVRGDCGSGHFSDNQKEL